MVTEVTICGSRQFGRKSCPWHFRISYIQIRPFSLDVAYRELQLLQLLLQIRMLLGHLFKLLNPLVTICLESLHLAFVMAGFDVSLAEPKATRVSNTSNG